MSAQVIQNMQHQVPDLVTSMKAVVAPLKKDIHAIQQWQQKLEQRLDTVGKSLNANRISNKVNRDKLNKLSKMVEDLTAAFKAMQTSPHAPGSTDPASAASSSSAPARAAPQAHIGAPRGNHREAEPEHLRTNLVKLPCRVHADHMRRRTWMSGRLCLTDLPAEDAVGATFLGAAISPKAGAMKIAVALDAIIFAVDAIRHGAMQQPTAVLDARLKQMRRRCGAVSTVPVGVLGRPL